ncbi:MAG: hypothetical protein IH870_01080 [Chloroflexi bacterium]|nr:hypothetical protein [Chloroflexota bacterium]
MAASRADQHDKDKLARWHGDLAGGVTGAFPLHALFLVSEVDRAAHDVFRAFRSRFEELGAGFQHLVIFGQHGVSQAEQTLLARLGLAADAIPSLVLLTASDPPLVYTLPLPSGDVGPEVKDPHQAPWRLVLAWVERERVELAEASGSADEVKPLALGNIPGMNTGTELSEPVIDLVAGMLEQLG